MIDVDDRDPSNRYAVFSGTTDTLFNNPIVSVLLIDKIESFCSSCFKPLIDKKVYCNNCKFVFYCSNECR